MSPTLSITKDEFVNDSEGYIGVVVINARGEQGAAAVAPGDTVWLSEEEQVLTANAPRHDGDNPLINGKLRLVTEAQEIRSKRPIRPAEGEAPGEPEEEAEEEAEEAPAAEETGAAPAPTGPAPEGERAAHEEVGTPEALAAEKPKPKPRRSS